MFLSLVHLTPDMFYLLQAALRTISGGNCAVFVLLRQDSPIFPLLLGYHINPGLGRTVPNSRLKKPHLFFFSMVIITLAFLSAFRRAESTFRLLFIGRTSCRLNRGISPKTHIGLNWSSFISDFFLELELIFEYYEISRYNIRNREIYDGP